MKRYFWIGLCLAACGGNYSNSDLEFINALPSRQDLVAKFPQTTQQSSLVGQVSAALQVGDPSPLYADTKNASDDFNRGIFSLLSLIDAIREVTPTHREPDRRIWGPFPSNDQPGFDVRVVMVRESASSYAYEVDFRRTAGGGDWFTVIQGAFLASGGVRKGSGLIQLFVAPARDRGLNMAGLENVNLLTAGYLTDRSPIEVTVTFAATSPSGDQEIAYRYREVVNGQKGIAFLWSRDVPGSSREVLAITSRWLPDGRGRADVAVLAGVGAGANQVECWDGNFRVVYSKKNWEAPDLAAGAESSCPNVDPFY